MNKEKLFELYNFVYYKICSIIKALLADIPSKAFLLLHENPSGTV